MITTNVCADLRREIKLLADRLNDVRREPVAKMWPHGPGPVDSSINTAEVIANATLAYRHLEDASMRLGKAIQALDGGVSVYDKDQVPKA